jgi:hypothetical protein
MAPANRIRPQINCREVARLYGGNATYNAIENFLRKPKAKAKELKAEAAGRDGPVASLARPRAPKTPTKKDSPKPTTPKSNGMLEMMTRMGEDVVREANAKYRCEDRPRHQGEEG